MVFMNKTLVYVGYGIFWDQLIQYYTNLLETLHVFSLRLDDKLMV